MRQSDFYRLFAETGEPLYWLLSRCSACSVPAQTRQDAPAACSPKTTDAQREPPPTAE